MTLLQRIWGLRKPRRLSSVVLRRARLSHLFTIRTSGVRLRFFPAVWTINLWEQPDYFQRDTELLRRWLREGDTVVDCGANVGLLTIVAATRVGPRGTVHSIEAHPRIFRFLEQNVALNRLSNVHLYHLAVGEKEGSIAFSDQIGDDGNHILPSGSGIRVAMKPVDAFVAEGTPVRLLKLDVEGYEKFVLEGARRLLATTEAIYFESSKVLFARYGYGCADVFELLTGAGFAIFRVGDDFTITRIAEGYDSTEIENLIALRDADGFAAATGYRIA